MIKGTMQLMNRIGIPVSIEIVGNNAIDFSNSMIRQMKTMGAFGFTPVEVPAGGFVFPMANHDDFDWSILGARKGEIKDKDNPGQMIPGVWFKGDFYTYRDSRNKGKGKTKFTDAIFYSRGARPTDPEHVQVGSDEIKYVSLVTFRVSGDPSYRIKELSLHDEDSAGVAPQRRNEPLSRQEPGKRSLLELTPIVKRYLEAAEKDTSRESINNTISLVHKKLKGLDEKIDVSRISPAQLNDVFNEILARLVKSDVITQEEADKMKVAAPPAPERPQQQQKPAQNTQQRPQQRRDEPEDNEDEEEDDIYDKARAAKAEKDRKKGKQPTPAPVKKAVKPVEPEEDDEEDDEEEEEVIPTPVKKKNAPKPVVEEEEEDEEEEDVFEDEDEEEDEEEAEIEEEEDEEEEEVVVPVKKKKTAPTPATPAKKRAAPVVEDDEDEEDEDEEEEAPAPIRKKNTPAPAKRRPIPQDDEDDDDDDVFDNEVDEDEEDDE